MVEATFDGLCFVCERRVFEGDWIVAGESGWVHAGCREVVPVPRNPLCRSCWVHHAGEC